MAPSDFYVSLTGMEEESALPMASSSGESCEGIDVVDPVKDGTGFYWTSAILDIDFRLDLPPPRDTFQLFLQQRHFRGGWTRPVWNNGAGCDLARRKYTVTFNRPPGEIHPGASRDCENLTSHQWSCMKLALAGSRGLVSQHSVSDFPSTHSLFSVSVTVLVIWIFVVLEG